MMDAAVDLESASEYQTLTLVEHQVLTYICNQFRKVGYTVSKKQLSQHFGALESVMHFALKELDRKGCIALAGNGRFTILRDEDGEFVVPMLLPASVANRIDQAKVPA